MKRTSEPQISALDVNGDYLIGLVKRAYPGHSHYEVGNGMRGCDPYCAFVRVDGDVMLDIVGDSRALAALELVLRYLAGSSLEAPRLVDVTGWWSVH